MLRLIILFLEALGFTQKTPPRLGKKQEVKIIKNDILIAILIISAMVLFVVLCYLLVPGTESGLVYHYQV